MTFGVIILILALLYLIFWGARKMAGKWRHRGRGRDNAPSAPSGLSVIVKKLNR